MAEQEIKQFKVGFHYEESGTCVVEARTEQEAMDIMTERLGQEGVDGLEYTINDRNYGGHTADEIKDYVVSSGINYGDVEFDDEYELEESRYDVEVFLFDMEDDPSTPYHQELLSIEASDEKTALIIAKKKANALPETAGVNVSVEAEIV